MGVGGQGLHLDLNRNSHSGLTTLYKHRGPRLGLGLQVHIRLVTCQLLPATNYLLHGCLTDGLNKTNSSYL